MRFVICEVAQNNSRDQGSASAIKAPMYQSFAFMDSAEELRIHIKLGNAPFRFRSQRGLHPRGTPIGGGVLVSSFRDVEV